MSRLTGRSRPSRSPPSSRSASPPAGPRRSKRTRPGPRRRRPSHRRRRRSRTDFGASSEVRGEVGTPQLYSKEEFARLPRQTVKAKGHDGVESQYEGVALVALIDRVGGPRGGPVEGSNGIEPLPRRRGRRRLPRGLRPARARSRLHRADHSPGRPPRGKPLSDREGPLQVIVPGEKKHVRPGSARRSARGRPGVSPGR